MTERVFAGAVLRMERTLARASLGRKRFVGEYKVDKVCSLEIEWVRSKILKIEVVKSAAAEVSIQTEMVEMERGMKMVEAAAGCLRLL